MLEVILPALIPALSDGVRGLVNKFTGGGSALPKSVDDHIRVMEADTARLQALAGLDSVNNAGQWVNNIRGIQRPAMALLVMLVYAYMSISDTGSMEAQEQVWIFVQMVTFYLFGDRSYMYLKKGG